MTHDPNTCIQCGNTDETVTLRVNPYLEDMFNQQIEQSICDNCINELVLTT